MPNDDSYDSISYYNQNAENFFESTINVDLKELYAVFIPYVAIGSKILDAGCGSGRDTKYFSELGYEVIAFDASPDLVALASKATNSEVICMTFDEVNWVNTFSGIWACASLLHLHDQAFKRAFNKLLGALKANGVLYCSFKYGESDSNVGDRYFNNQTEHTIKTTLSEYQNIFFEKIWITGDKRPNRANEKWLNLIIRKD